MHRKITDYDIKLSMTHFTEQPWYERAHNRVVAFLLDPSNVRYARMTVKIHPHDEYTEVGKFSDRQLLDQNYVRAAVFRHALDYPAASTDDEYDDWVGFHIRRMYTGSLMHLPKKVDEREYNLWLTHHIREASEEMSLRIYGDRSYDHWIRKRE